MTSGVSGFALGQPNAVVASNTTASMLFPAAAGLHADLLPTFIATAVACVAAYGVRALQKRVDLWRVTPSSTEVQRIEKSSELRYFDYPRLFLAPGMTQDEATDLIGALRYRPVEARETDPVHTMYGRGLKTIGVVGENDDSFYAIESRYLQFLLDEAIDPASFDLRPGQTVARALFGLRQIIGRDAEVLYPGSGDDRSVERVFSRTTHLDLDDEFGRIKGKRIIGDMTAMPFGDSLFDVVVLRGIGTAGYWLYNEPIFFSEQARVLRPGGFLLDMKSHDEPWWSPLSVVRHRQHRFFAAVHHRMVEPFFGQVGLIRQRIDGIGDLQAVYRKTAADKNGRG